MFSRLTAGNMRRGQQSQGKRRGGPSESHRRKLKTVLKALHIPVDHLDFFVKVYSSAVEQNCDVPEEDLDRIRSIVEPEGNVLFTPEELDIIAAALSSSNQADQVAASCLLRAIMEDDTTAGVAGGMVSSAAYDAFLDPSQANIIVRVNLLNAMGCGLYNMPFVYDGALPERFCEPSFAHDLLALVSNRWNPERPVAEAAQELLTTMIKTGRLGHVFVSDTYIKAVWQAVCDDALDNDLRRAHVDLLNAIWSSGKNDPEMVTQALRGWAELNPASKVLDFLTDGRDFLLTAGLDVLADFLPAALDISQPVVDVIQQGEFVDLFLSAVTKVGNTLLVEEAFTAVILAGQGSLTNCLLQSTKLVSLLNDSHENQEFLDVMYSVLLAVSEPDRAVLWQLLENTPLATHGYSHLATAPTTSDFVLFALAYDPNAVPKLVSAFSQGLETIADAGLDDADPAHITQLLTQLNALFESDHSVAVRTQLLEQSPLWDVVRIAMMNPTLRLDCTPLRLVVNNLARTLPSVIPTITTIMYSPAIAQIQSKLADALPILSNIVKTNRINPESNDLSAVLMVIDLFEDIGKQLANFTNRLDPAIMTALCTELPDTFKDMFLMFQQLLEVVLLDEDKYPGLLQKLSAAVEPYYIARSKEGHCKPTYSTQVEQFAQDVELDRENGVIGEYMQVIASTVEALVHYDELRQPCLDLLPPLAAALTLISVRPSILRSFLNIVQQVPDEDFDVFHEIGIMYYDRMIATTSTFSDDASFMTTLLALERLFIRGSSPSGMHWVSSTKGLTVNSRGNILNNGTTLPQCARGSLGVSGGGKYGFSIQFTEDALGAIGFTNCDGPLNGQQDGAFVRKSTDNAEFVVMDLSTVYAWHSGKCQYNTFAGFASVLVTCVIDLDLGHFLVRIGKHGQFRRLITGLDCSAVWYPYMLQPPLSASETMFFDDARLTGDNDDFVPIGLTPTRHLEPPGHDAPPLPFIPLSDPVEPPVDEDITLQYYYELEATPASPIVAVGFRQVFLYSLWVATRGLEAVVQFVTGGSLEESVEWQELIPALIQWAMKRQGTADEDLPDRFAAHFTSQAEAQEDLQGWRKWSISVEPACVEDAPNVPDDGHVLFVSGIVINPALWPGHDPAADRFMLAPYCSDRLLFGVAAATESGETIEDANCFMIVTKGTDHVYDSDGFSKLVLAHTSELHALPVSVGMQGVKMIMHTDVSVQGGSQIRGPFVRQSGSPESVLYLTMANWGVPPPGFGDDDDDGWADEDELDVD